MSARMRRFACLAAALVPTLALPCTPPRVDPWSISTEPNVTVSCELEDPAMRGKADCSRIVVTAGKVRWEVPNRTFNKDEVWTVDGGRLLIAGGIAVTVFERHETENPRPMLRNTGVPVVVPRFIDIVGGLNAIERRRLPKAGNCKDPRHVRSAKRVGGLLQIRVFQFEGSAAMPDLVFDVNPDTLATVRHTGK